MDTSRLIYAGRRRGRTVPIVYVYVPEDGSADLFYKKPLVPSLGVGYVIEVTHPEDKPGSIYTKGEYAPRVVGFAEGHDDLSAWQAEDRAAYEIKAQADAAKRQEARTREAGGLLEDHIGFVAQAGGSLSWRDQDAFIAYVSSRIRSGR